MGGPRCPVWAGAGPGCQHRMSQPPEDNKSRVGRKREGLAEVTPCIDTGQPWFLSVMFINAGNETDN